GFEIGGGAARNVVEDDGLVDRFGNGAEVPVLALLRRLVVVGRRGQDGVDAWPRGYFFRFGHSLVRRVGSGAGDDGHASGGDFNGYVDNAQPLIVGECGSFSRGAAGNQEVDARFDLPGDQVAQCVFVDSTVLRERCDQSGTTASQLHGSRITLLARACMSRVCSCGDVSAELPSEYERIA